MKGLLSTLVAVVLISCASNEAQSSSPPSKIIGSASMDADRMITVMLRAEDGHGVVGDAAFFMNPGHKDYQKTIQHVGGLKPGQTKPYPAGPHEE